MLMLFFALAAERPPAVLIADTVRHQHEFKQCLADQVVALGAGNQETGDTLVRAAASACLPVETALRALYAETPLAQHHVERLMMRDRKLGEDAGIARLLTARSAR